MEGLTKIVMYILPIIVLVLLVMYYFAPESGAFEKLRSGVNKAKEYLPNISVGGELQAGKPTLSEAHKKEVLQLNATINQMLASGKKNCFGDYGGVSMLGSSDTEKVSILMGYDAANDATKFTFQGGVGGEQTVTDFEFSIPGMVPCVIAGGSAVTRAFEESFLNGDSWSEKEQHIRAGHYRQVGAITIQYYEGKSFACQNANRIQVPELGGDIVNDECNNFLDRGMLYTPDNRHICFFPTVYGDNSCDGGDKDGLDDDCLGEDPQENIAIPKQLGERKLLKC